ncbi:AraC family transcriptional regulator [Flammeovirga sp. OC4]|uniref:helix-turn-helix domain-containing protein n=1 Tax=Flammeovirga sp. OC4 TaxID=1382345 RepID=UPI0005C56053|nr:AraC family transcriptional regulator [Flammeovirga sp. OC4]
MSLLSYDHFQLNGKPVFEKASFKPPLKKDATMNNEACFIHVLHGKAMLYATNEQYTFTSSDSFLMKCGNYVNHWVEQQEEQPYEAILIHFYPDTLKYVYDEGLPEVLKYPRKVSQNVEKIPLDEMITTYIDSLLFYFKNPSMVNEELIKLKVKELVLLLSNAKEGNNVKALLSSLFQPEETQFKKIIHSHLYEDLSIEDIAILTGLSLSTFKRKFRQTFDESPKQYINKKRIQKASELLIQTNHRISEICYDCGFNDVGYFSKVFHQHYGFSPSSFRKKEMI